MSSTDVETSHRSADLASRRSVLPSRSARCTRFGQYAPMTTESGRPDEGHGDREVASAVEPSVVTCVVDLTRDDFRAWVRYSRRHVRGRPFWSSLVSYGCALGAGVAAAIVGAPVAALLAFAAAAGSIVMQNSPPYGSYLGHCRYAADAEGFTTETNDGWTRCRWAAFERVGESADHFFLINAALGAIIIPKRGFAAAGDVARFRTLASAVQGA